MPPEKDSKPKRDRYSTNLKRSLAEVVKRLADKERRTFAAQVQLLIEEALAGRTSNQDNALLTVKQQLHQLSVPELAEVVELAGKLQTQQMQALQPTLFWPNNKIAALAKKHKTLCQEAFADNLSVFEQILKGGKPREEDLPLLAACTACELDEMFILWTQEFKNENGTSCQNCNC